MAPSLGLVPLWRKGIYDKFFRVDKARSREINSHGLGLSIVRKITDALNIDIN